MSTITNHINTYANTTAYDNDLNKDYPNVSYIEEDDIVLFEKINYAQEYFAIESLEDNNTIMFKLFTKSGTPSSSSAKTISVSTDDGKTWANYTSTTGGMTIATLNNGEKVLIKGNNSAYADSYGYNYFYTTRQFDVSGNIMSLIYGDNFKEKYSFPSGTKNNFQNLFYQNTGLVNAENLVLSATTLAQYCYSDMFSGCTSLTTAPSILPATTLAQYCYSDMFSGCTSLTTAPELPAETLASNCYIFMFRGCTSLTTAPELPATSLVNECYSGMFSGCTNLKTAPELPATRLAERCYQNMFYNCTSLTTAPELTATTLANYCYQNMFYNCTSLTTAPELPATTLADSCYSQMFQGCTNLKTAPKLPATRLTYFCYDTMFYGCTKLNYIKAMFTTKPSDTYTKNWVSGVSASGTFVKNSAATWNVTGVNGVPTGWTIQKASS